MEKLLQTASQLGYRTLDTLPSGRSETAVRLLIDLPNAAGLTVSGGVLQSAVSELPSPQLQTTLEQHTGHALSLVVTTPEIFAQLKAEDQSLKQTHPGNLLTPLLNTVTKIGGSDLILTLGAQPSVKTQGKYQTLTDHPQLSKKQLQTITQWLNVTTTGVVTIRDRKWRITVTDTSAHPTIAFRAIASHPPRPEEINIPAPIIETSTAPHGLLLITSPPGHGRTTTLASLTERLVLNEPKHIATIAPTPEFRHTSRAATVTPLPSSPSTDTATAVTTATQISADIITLELQDTPSIKAALQAALAGHFVIATLAAPNIPAAIQQLTSRFTPEEQPWALHALSTTLQAVLSQTLLPTEQGHRVGIYEYVIIDNVVRELIRSNHSHHIPAHLSDTSSKNHSLDHALASAVTAGVVTEDTARSAVSNETEYSRHLTPEPTQTTKAPTQRRRRRK